MTIEQIIAALEKKNLRQTASISNERPVTLQTRQAKFQSLVKEREQELPNESYEDRFNAVADTQEGQQLLNQMHRPTTAEENQSDKPPVPATAGVGLYRTKEEARSAFKQAVEELLKRGLTRDQAWSTAAHTTGKDAYLSWKTLAAAELPEKIIGATTPHPSESSIAKARARLEAQNK